ncbi:acyltransferase family protein [Sphingobium algorifonticola]|uniref:Acyltransferase n=1 Tax=Sphingobium algorifonticola TaxID=2008318 RepID=A0A437J5F3_9SPHN|nr:acyltransferase [Sphingobium algorifonticola]RVT40136.1 acyltransferase [Sphingobium algorifonticola]
MTGELRSLTAARGIAAWLVVVYHIRSGTPWLPDWLMAVAHKGYLAVDFFFLLSGFVIYLSAHRAFLRQGHAAIGPFLIRRAARIYPLYGVMLGLTVLFAIALEASGRQADGYPWRELPLHVVMMQNWGFTDALSWNHPAWSISAETAAYLAFPLLVLRTPIARARRPHLLAAIAAVLALLAATLEWAGATTLGTDIPRFGLIRCLAEFAAGAMLCAFWLRGPDREPMALILSAGGVLLCWGLWLSGYASELWAFPAGAACLILALAHASALPHNPLHARAFQWLGEISYATYLSHFMLYIWFKIAFVDDADNVAPAVMAPYLMMTLALSALLHYAVERPGRDWMSGALKGAGGGTKAAGAG